VEWGVIGSSVGELSVEERAHCDAESRLECRRVVIAQGLSVGTALSVAGSIEFFSHHAAYHDHMLTTLPWQIFFAFFASAALYFGHFLRPYTISFAMLMVIVVGSLGGLVLGGMGGFDGPFFYSIYMMPTFVMLVPCKLSMRIAGTFAVLIGFLSLFLSQQQQIVLIAPDITSVSVFIIAAACVLLGHRDWIVSRERSLAMFRLERDREATRARNNELAERVRSQARRARSLANELLDVRSSERLNLARDLHDDVGQLLVGAKMELELLEHMRSLDESLDIEQLARLYDVMFGLEDGIREMIRRLRSASAPFDLTSALEELFDAYRQHGKSALEVEIDTDLFVAFSNEVDHLVFRVVQEGLTNAAKHADAKHWRVVIREEEGALCVRVEDDGAGSLPEGGGDGWGILGLVERARALGGEVVLSRRKQGDGGTRTVLEAILPGVAGERDDALAEEE
jgi:signal transduction histidine kinase